MSKAPRTGKKKASAAPPPGAAEALYVYCVGESEALMPLLAEAPPAAVEEGAALEVVASGGLAAVASVVPLSVFGEEALPGHLTDPTWTAVRAMRHERVVEHFAARSSIIPLRFGTIYLERARIVRMLEERRAELGVIIERLRGHEEWGVNVYCEAARLKEVIDEISPRLREMGERAAAASPGQSYLMRKKIDALRAEETRAEVRRVAAGIERKLAAESDGAVRLRVLKDEAGEHGEVVAKLAFLVATAQFDRFRRAAEEMAAETSAAGFRLELTGPWPAYNFATPAGEPPGS